jgi:hypothetical protein
MDKVPDASCDAGLGDGARAEYIGAEVGRPRPPDAGFSGDMEDGGAAFHCGAGMGRIGNVARYELHSTRDEVGPGGAPGGAHSPSAVEAALDDGLAEEAASTGD